MYTLGIIAALFIGAGIGWFLRGVFSHNKAAVSAVTSDVKAAASAVSKDIGK